MKLNPYKTLSMITNHVIFPSQKMLASIEYCEFSQLDLCIFLVHIDYQFAVGLNDKVGERGGRN